MAIPVEDLPYLDSKESIQSYLKRVAKEEGVELDDLKLATALDSKDKLAPFRARFCVPTIGEVMSGQEIVEGVDTSEECMYFNGVSLGLQPKGTRELVTKNLDKWAFQAMEGHVLGHHSWMPGLEKMLSTESAKLVGAKPIEVVCMNTLTVNCHLAMASFYQPKKDRFKILLEKDSFPSDFYAIESQMRWHGYDPKEASLFVTPREGEQFWRTEDIVKIIEEQGDTIAFVWLPGVHYLTGYVFDMKTITEVAHKKGCYVGFDLAHAAGNVEMSLHDWGVDVAAWCSYKYLNGGPGGIAGFFVHEKHAHNDQLPRLLGWWSHERETRFVMNNVLELQPGAAGFQLSNPPVFECLCLKASLDVFADTSMRELTTKSRLLTGYLEILIEHYLTKETSSGQHYVILVSPSNPKQRGNSLTLQFSLPMTEAFIMLQSRGALTGLCRFTHTRVGVAPLYTSFKDMWRFFQILKDITV